MAAATENTVPAATKENAGLETEASEPQGGKDITVFHDTENFNVKHPLMHEWTLWFTKPPSGKVRFSCARLVDRRLTDHAGRQLDRFAQGSRHV